MKKDMEPKIDKKVILDVLDGIIKKAQEERQKSEPYKELFQTDDIVSLISKARHQMDGIILDTAQVLKEKYGIKVTNEKYQFLQGLPLFGSIVRKWFENNEGRSCCEDKTRYWLGKFIQDSPLPPNNLIKYEKRTTNID